MSADTHLHWTQQDGSPASALWRSEAAVPAPQRVLLVDDTTPADKAYKLACEGTGLLWTGDFQNARHLLQALTRRLDKTAAPKRGAANKRDEPPHAGLAFHQHRQRLAHRARILGMLLIPFNADHTIPLRRAPDVQQACLEGYGPGTEAYVTSLRELLGLIGAHEWRKKGVAIDALKGKGSGRIHAHYGVFSPVRGEYVDLVQQAPLPAGIKDAVDVGTGSGVLAAVLASRGIARITATDQDARALACAQENLHRLKLDKQVNVIEADLFPPGQAPLIVCNPPWLPARPSSPIEYAVYDPDSRMLRGFLAGLKAHLTPGGEGWLIMSDLAEHLGLRGPDELQGWIRDAGLQVLGRLDARPRHPKVQDANDPLHRARAAEITSLWRLAAA
ncbi:MAG TPA: class I SAM-dependent methyltransferase [Aquabacterium sp.]|uniref:class I SAM-dependent methyltransferase n=1 Tax=Aquabacterium sp. TaxID=1872578 RepID=UPI002E30E8F4|nr:class I SAM-dependent methyltransferase [Aquabacterium sp.]HEX5355536.1 class I SAM-dependent methyltransferase [Aquabacterium sp.]